MDRLAIFCSYLAAANDEIVDAVCGIHFHNVPKNRAAADFDHGLWLEMCSLGNSSSESTSEYDGFHFECFPQGILDMVSFHLTAANLELRSALAHCDTLHPRSVSRT